MQLSFHGAAREVTGSCHLVETGSTRFLIDCGMFQGVEFASERNAEPFDFDPKSIDFVILTHAHMDHSGRLPSLCKAGFKGPIYCTAPTKDFTEIMLEDSARVIFEEALAHNRLPLYLVEDVMTVVKQCQTVDYRKEFQPVPGIRAQFRDAGHILGSAFVELWITEGEKTKKIVFSGDLGNPPMPLLRDTEFADGADVVVMETTYGGRIHEPAAMRHDMLRDVFRMVAKRGGTLLIPAFALERTQQVLYELNDLVEKHQVPRMPVYVDSPLAIKATAIYKKYEHLFDKEALDHIRAGDDLFRFPGLQFTTTGHESRGINNVPPPKVIIAGSGMCTGGRIVGHLAHYLGNAKNHLLIIGYQPHDSIGRMLLDGERRVEISGHTVEVHASVSAIGAYSAHGDQPKLLHWIKEMTNPKPTHVYLVHGEKKAAMMIADGLKQKLQVDSTIPEYHKTYEV
jgi:metallo-beta-lactamase family protein